MPPEKFVALRKIIAVAQFKRFLERKE